MASIALFHSVYGRRPAVAAAAARLRDAGHEVIAPDLYAGQVAQDVDGGFALCTRIGWPAILERARLALAQMPPGTVLAGLSMGASVAAALLGERPQCAGLLLLHNTGSGDAAPAAARPGLPVHLHIANPDIYQSAAELAGWEQNMTEAGARTRVFRYPGAGHLFTDPSLPDYDAPSESLTWLRSENFLAARED